MYEKWDTYLRSKIILQTRTYVARFLLKEKDTIAIDKYARGMYRFGVNFSSRIKLASLVGLGCVGRLESTSYRSSGDFDCSKNL